MALDHELSRIASEQDQRDFDDPRMRALIDGSGFSVASAAAAIGAETIPNEADSQVVESPTVSHTSRRGGRAYPEMGARDRALYDNFEGSDRSVACPIVLSPETIAAKKALSEVLARRRVARQLLNGVDPRVVAARERARVERKNVS